MELLLDNDSEAAVNDLKMRIKNLYNELRTKSYSPLLGDEEPPTVLEQYKTQCLEILKMV